MRIVPQDQSGRERYLLEHVSEAHRLVCYDELVAVAGAPIAKW